MAAKTSMLKKLSITVMAAYTKCSGKHHLNDPTDNTGELESPGTALFFSGDINI